MSAGIDYGMGRTNIDNATGIRYGVISQHAMASWFFDSFEPQYGDPTCPECGNSVQHAAGEPEDDYKAYRKHGCADYVCHACQHTLDSSDVWPEDPIGHTLDTDGIQASDCLDSDVIITRSPFYTYGPFCSPCVPGAVSLENHGNWTDATGIRAYCFDHSWFEDGKAPYRVFRVDDNSEVLPG